MYLAGLNPLWELDPKLYQLPQMSIAQIVGNLVDCQVVVEWEIQLSSSVPMGEQPNNQQTKCDSDHFILYEA